MTGRDGLPRGLRLAALLVAGTLLVSACTTPILANDPLVFPPPPTPSAEPSRFPDPLPISLPRDDGPHGRLTEWWYYTGHLRTPTGRRFGFEAVVFRAERGSVPTAWAAHLALTDEQGGAFHYAQRSEIGPEVDHSPVDASGEPTGFDLQVRGLSPTIIAAGAPPLATSPWRLAGANGTDHIDAALAPEEAAASGAAFGLQLDLQATKPPAFHDGDGFVDFGPAGSSYYYSRTRLTATGALDLDGQHMTVDGIAWFDHQWGNFMSIGGGGWDWFAINLDDGVDLTFSIVRDASLQPILRYGTRVDAVGAVANLDASAFEIDAGGPWTSPTSGQTYALGWSVDARPALGLLLQVTPDLDNQELDARATSGVAYWEGSSRVTGSALGSSTPLGGQAYVEITRYGN